MKYFYYNLHGGLNTQLTPILMGANTQKIYWADGYNVEPYKNQGVTRQKGNQIILDYEKQAAEVNSGYTNEPAEGDLRPGKPAGLIPYPKGSKNFLLAFTDGQIFYFDAELRALKAIYDFKQKILKFAFEHFLDGVVILPVKYTGSAIDGVYFNPDSTPQVSALGFANRTKEGIYPTAVCQYASRLWISSGSTVYYSALGTYNDWDTSHDAGYISNFHSSTAEILAIKEYRGSLAFYKEYEVFLLSGNDPETFAITKFADKGAPGPGCVITCNNKQYFFNDCGLFSLSYVGELSQIVMGTNCAKNVARLFEKLDKTRIVDTIILAYEIKNQIWIFPPILGEKGQKEVWIYDYGLDCWFIRIIPYEITGAACVWGEIYTICPEKNVIFVENKGNTFASKPINFRFSTPFFNFSKPTVPKIIEEFEIICDGASENDFDFSVSSDYITESVTEPENVCLDLPNVLVWEGKENNLSSTMWAAQGDSTYGAIWKDIFQESLKLDIFEANKSVQLHFEGNREGQNITIIGFEFKDILFEQ